MEILARAVGRRKEAVAQVQLVSGNGQFLINDKPAQAYLQNNSCSLICIKSPLQAALSLFSNDPLVTASVNQTDLPPNSSVIAIGTLSDENSSVFLPLGATEEQGKAELKSENISGLEQPVSLLDGAVQNQKNGVLSSDSMKIETEGVFNWAERKDEIDIIVKVRGGGLIGQAEAIKLGIARAFCIMENVYGGALLRKILKTKGYLRQDSRVKERRKYGLKKARKASQYHKR